MKKEIEELKKQVEILKQEVLQLKLLRAGGIEHHYHYHYDSPVVQRPYFQRPYFPQPYPVTYGSNTCSSQGIPLTSGLMR